MVRGFLEGPSPFWLKGWSLNTTELVHLKEGSPGWQVGPRVLRIIVELFGFLKRDNVNPARERPQPHSLNLSAGSILLLAFVECCQLTNSWTSADGDSVRRKVA